MQVRPAVPGGFPGGNDARVVDHGRSIQRRRPFPIHPRLRNAECGLTSGGRARRPRAAPVRRRAAPVRRRAVHTIQLDTESGTSKAELLFWHCW